MYDNIIKDSVLKEYKYSSSKFGKRQDNEFYDVILRNFYRHFYTVKRILKYAPKETHNKILDVCMGFGVPSRVLRNFGYDIHGTDSEVIGGKRVCQIISEDFPLNIVNNIETEQLPFDEGSFDVILWLATIEHLHGSPRNIMEQFHDILRKGGILIVDTPNILELRKRIMLLMGKSFMPPIQYIYNSEYHADHHREYTLSDLVKVFQWSKYEVLEAKVLDTISGISIKKGRL